MAREKAREKAGEKAKEKAREKKTATKRDTPVSTTEEFFTIQPTKATYSLSIIRGTLFSIQTQEINQKPISEIPVMESPRTSGKKRNLRREEKEDGAAYLSGLRVARVKSRY